MIPRAHLTSALLAVLFAGSLLLTSCAAVPPAVTAAPAVATVVPLPATAAPVVAPATAVPVVAAATVAPEVPAPEAIVIREARFADGAVHVAGEAAPAFEQTVAIRVLDGAGEVLVQATTTLDAPAGERGRFVTDVPVSGAAAVVQVYDTSARDGGIVHLASAWLDTPAGALAGQGAEAIAIDGPAAGATVNGRITVTGTAGPTFEQALLVQVYDVTGALAGEASGTISAELGSAGPFAIEVTIAPGHAGPGRVVVSSASPRNGALTHVASVDVNLVK